MNKKIAVIDDEAPIRESLKGVLEDEGFQVLTAQDGESGIRVVRENIPDLVLLDIWMKGIDGIEVLKRLKQELPFIPIIIMSGHATIDLAVNATKLGAYDFIEKPISLERLFLLIENAIRYFELLNENLSLKERISKDLTVVSKSEKIHKILEDMKALSASSKTLLFLGEEGVGKSFFARYYHKLKGKDEPDFYEFNFLNADEQELDRLIKNVKKKKNLTIYIPEFHLLPVNVQNLLLQIKGEGDFILSSSSDIQQDLQSGKISPKFYFGMEIVPLYIPPLRDRREDIEPFIDFYSAFLSKQYGRKLKFTREAFDILTGYSWKGNLKELKNFLEYQYITSQSEVVTQRDLPDNIKLNCRLSLIEDDIFKHNLLSEAKRRFEKEFIRLRLSETCGNIKRAAEIMGIKESLLRSKIKYYGLSEMV